MQIRTGIASGKGLGDAIADFTHVTGLDRIASFYEKATGKDCGCDQRRQTLNQIFPMGGNQA